jgi:molybdopterin molybdotransferase
MISVAKALSLIEPLRLPAVMVPLSQAAGKTLAQDIHAPCDIPGFAQSSMDGYAFAFGASDLVLCGEVPAGKAPEGIVGPGQAMRIFTGAMLPKGTDTVVMQEKVARAGDRITINDPQLVKGANVRPRGAYISSGALALAKGARLGPAAIGFLAGMGVDSVSIHQTPRIALITTGNELQKPGTPLKPAQVYESNSFTLKAALGESLTLHLSAPDDPSTLIGEALEKADILLVTGGVSVGDYDLVAEALGKAGVTKVFHGVRQRPGKPLFYGVQGTKPVFGLPGNPSSVLTCFYIYIYPMLGSINHLRLPLTAAYQKPAGLTHFLKGIAEETGVTPLGAQESYRMSTYALSNCLIRLPEEGTLFARGQPVDVYLLP